MTGQRAENVQHLANRTLKLSKANIQHAEFEFSWCLGAKANNYCQCPYAIFPASVPNMILLCVLFNLVKVSLLLLNH